MRLDHRDPLSWATRRLLPALLWNTVSALGRSLRIRTLGAERHQALQAEQAPLIYAFWHGHQLGLLWCHRERRDIDVLVSLSRDGGLLAGVLRRAGISCVRGSSSRGGAEALEELLLRLGSGRSVALTPDGPRGPLHSVAPGVLALARWSGRPIVPVAVAYRSAWQLRSWDRFLLPRPGTRMALGYGEPLWVPPGRSSQEPALQLARALHDLTAELQHSLGLPQASPLERRSLP